MKKIFLLVLAVLCALSMTGCKSIDYGTVMDKSFAPAHRVYSPIITHIGKTTRVIPRWLHHPDRWSILVENEDGKDWWNVSEDYYNTVNIGDTVDRRTP